MLIALKKTEDSLRKLKKIKQKESPPLTAVDVLGSISPMTPLTDEEKIILQLCLDVEQFGKQLRSFHVATDTFNPYRELRDLLPSADK
jgi:hypothetical protein